MKKTAFVLTEIFLSLVLTVSVAAAAACVADIRTGGSVLPDRLMGLRLHNGKNNTGKKTQTESQPVQESQQSDDESSKPAESSAEASGEESQVSQTSAESSAEISETSKTSEAKEMNLILEEPKDLKKQPAELTKMIKAYGYDYDMLGFDQFIVVDAGDNSTAKIYCYERSSKGIWWDIAGEGKPITDKAFVGEKGIGFDVSPGSKKTPMGVYSLGDGFYIGEKPDTTYPLFEITDNTYWVDDTKSKFYNQKVEGTAGKDWSSADHMIASADSYRYGLVVEFNTSKPADKKLAGSIFVHCGDAPTGGSIVVPENVMKSILTWLRKGSHTYIFIT